ncbi:MAG: carboxymuconolactone decarboxylase family protein [Bacteroidia bacterium]|nr:carboxymuconolactone decarboxylase family protein [Bacteroidia bacterium]
MSLVEAFTQERKRLNAIVLATDSRIIKRVYSVDSQTYEPGALDGKTKELLGLCASLVLRCDDCVKYHIGAAIEAGATKAEVVESLEIALVVGGTIVVPHLRRAVEFLDERAPA